MREPGRRILAQTVPGNITTPSPGVCASPIKQKRGLIAVKDLKEELQVSYKSLDRWFLKYIGLTPKRFTQLTRFRNILQELDEQTNPDWMQFVLDYNFFDQAHFIKEFRQFAGVSPTEFCLSRNSEGADSNSII